MQETLYNRQWMQLSLYQTEDAGVSKVDPGVRDYITQRLQETLYQTAETGDYIRQQMQETLSDSRCKRLYLTADAREFIRQDARDYIRQDAGVSISDSGCKRLCIRQQMQATL